MYPRQHNIARRVSNPEISFTFVRQERIPDTLKTFTHSPTSHFVIEKLYADKIAAQASFENLEPLPISISDELSEYRVLSVDENRVIRYQHKLDPTERSQKLKTENNVMRNAILDLQGDVQALKVEAARVKRRQRIAKLEAANLRRERKIAKVEAARLRRERETAKVEAARLRRERETTKVEAARLRRERETAKVEAAHLKHEQEQILQWQIAAKATEAFAVLLWRDIPKETLERLYRHNIVDFFRLRLLSGLHKKYGTPEPEYLTQVAWDAYMGVPIGYRGLFSSLMHRKQELGGERNAIAHPSVHKSQVRLFLSSHKPRPDPGPAAMEMLKLVPDILLYSEVDDSQVPMFVEG